MKISKLRLILIGCLAVADLHPASADVVGTVVDEDGNGIGGATVSLMRYETQYVVPPGTQITFSAVTGSTGQFAISSPPAGNYMLCTDGPSTSYISSCEWASGRVLAVSGTAQVDVPNATLSAATLLTITIQDPQGLIPKFTPPQLASQAPKVIVGVVDTSGRFHRAQPVWATGSVSFSVAVPPSMKLGLWVFSNDLVITDTSGTSIEKDAATISAGVAAGSTVSIDPSLNANITLAVAGTK